LGGHHFSDICRWDIRPDYLGLGRGVVCVMVEYIIIYGGVFDGVQGAVGPFRSEYEAEEYMDSHNLGHFEKAVITLEKPEDD